MDYIKKNLASKDPYRNLLIHSTNSLLEAGKISLVAPPNYNEIRINRKYSPEAGYMFTKIGGKICAINWFDIGHQEIRISAWWNYNHKYHPRADEEEFVSRTPLAKYQKFKDFVGVCCSVELERQDGKYLMGKGKKHINDIYTRKNELKKLQSLDLAICKGFNATGPFRT